MAILKNIQPMGNHCCETPKNPEKEYGAGTIWECDVCKRQAKLVRDYRDGWTWQWLLPENYFKP